MRILLVEDNADHRELMSLALIGHDPTWQVEEVASGEEALRRLAEEEAYDLVFLDYSLPGRNGLEVLEEIRQGEAPPPVVVVTGRGDEQVAVEAMKGGAYDYVVKQESYLQRLPVVAQRAVEAYRLAAERKLAEEALQQAAIEWRTTFDATVDGICLLDRDQRIQRCNKAISQIFGKDFDEIIGRHCWEIVHGRSEPIPECPIARMRRSLQRESMELHLGQQWLEVTVDPILDEDGSLIGVVHIVRDITERKRAEEELIRLSNAVRMSTDSIVIGDLEAKIIDVNEATLRMYGADDKGDLVGKNSFDLIAPEDREKAFASMEETLARGYTEGREYHIVIKDGSKIPVEMNSALMKDAEGRPIGFASISRDITERKRAEEALRYQAYLLKNVSDAIISTDVNFNIKSWNKAAETIYGWQADEVIGKQMAHVTKMQYAPREREALIRELGIVSSSLEMTRDRFTLFPRL